MAKVRRSGTEAFSIAESVAWWFLLIGAVYATDVALNMAGSEEALLKGPMTTEAKAGTSALIAVLAPLMYFMARSRV